MVRINSTSQHRNVRSSSSRTPAASRDTGSRSLHEDISRLHEHLRQMSAESGSRPSTGRAPSLSSPSRTMPSTSSRPRLTTQGGDSFEPAPGTGAAGPARAFQAEQAQSSEGIGSNGNWDPSYYVNQLDHPGANQNCGPATLSMMLKKNGLANGRSDGELVADMAEQAGTNVNGYTGPYQWVETARANGLKVTDPIPANYDPNSVDTEWMKSELDQGKSVIANLRVPLGDHFLVVTGHDGQGNFYVADPSDTSRTVVSEQWLKDAIASNSNGGYYFSVG